MITMLWEKMADDRMSPRCKCVLVNQANRFRSVLLLTSFVLLIGCADTPSSPTPQNADKLILYSINGPAFFRNEGVLTATQAKGELFHGYPVLGKIEVVEKNEKENVIHIVIESIRNPVEPEAKCFIPRHAIKVIQDDVEYDYLICFQCHNYELYTSRKGSAPVTKGRISSAPQTMLDKHLTEAGISLAPK